VRRRRLSRAGRRVVGHRFLDIEFGPGRDVLQAIDDDAFAVFQPGSDDAFVAALEHRLRTRRLRLLVLHEPALAPARFEHLFARVLPACRQAGVPLLVGPGHAPSFARAAQGTLLSGDDLHRVGVRPPCRLVAAACRDRGDLEAAHRLGVDLAVVDAALLSRAAGTLRQPTYVIGMPVQEAIASGAHGIVPGAEFWQAE